jgi:acyl-[acyl carrier protein]--UDP-N-acetylglucosamine O-acyltransferase
VQYNCFVSCNSKIGDNALLLFASCIGHDSIIGNDSVISTLVSISGSCTVGDRTYISVSVPVKEKISIGSDTIIGMGSVVLRDIPDNVIALGNPARPMKNNESGRVFK